MRQKRGFVLSLSALLLGACLYSFTGGGLPNHIRTVAVLPFDNLTSDPTLTQEINVDVRDAMEKRLGLRPAGESAADAIVKGTITRYEPDVALAYQGDTRGALTVTNRQLQISVTIQIMDQREGKVLWESTGLTVEGQYPPGQEAKGRRDAREKLITKIVEGAQSQW